MMPSGRILMSPGPEYHDYLAKKIETARRLTDALFSWMTIEAENDLRALQSQPAPSPIDTMAGLQSQLESVLARKEQMEAVIKQVAEKSGTPELAEVMRMAFVSALDDQIDYLNSAMSAAQAAAEKDSAA